VASRLFPGDESQRLEVYGDSADGTGKARAKYRQGGHDTVIKPKPLRPAVDGGFTLDDFTINKQDTTLTRPGGHTRPMSAKQTVTFGKLCADCPLPARCTTAQQGRSMTIHPHQQLLRAARAQARTPKFKQAYPTRSAIERIIA
jgi:Transposase DDE domain